jgi:hypothetical protein
VSAAASIYADQSASELHLHLLRGDLDLAQFTVLETASLRRPWVELTACIVGASHVLRVELPGESPLHEILACGPVSGSAERLFDDRATDLERGVTLDIAPGRTYGFRSWVLRGDEGREPLTEMEARLRRARATRDDRELGIRFDFPAEPSRPLSVVGAGPTTLLLVSSFEPGSGAEDATICVETAHSYPNDRAVVFSRTEIRAKGGAC